MPNHEDVIPGPDTASNLMEFAEKKEAALNSF